MYFFISDFLPKEVHSWRQLILIFAEFPWAQDQGVDPAIRAEVWEFLLGCYALGSTSEYRKQLRIARRFVFLAIEHASLAADPVDDFSALNGGIITVQPSVLLFR